MKTTITKFSLIALVAAAVVGCAAPGPAQPQGPRVPVNTEANIQAFREAERERLRVKFEAEADAKAREEQVLRERAMLQYLEQKQRHLESQPRGLPPLPPRPVVRKKPTAPTPPAAPAQPCAASTACPAAAAVAPTSASPAAATPPAAEAPAQAPQASPAFVPRRSAS